MSYPKNYIAIDIGNESIKIANLSRKKDKVVITQFAIIDTPENSINDGIILNQGLISDVINKALTEEKIKIKNVVFIISSTKIITREVEFPKLKPTKLKAVIDMNAADYFPVNLNEYILDYVVTESIIVKDENILKVDIIAAQGKLVESYVELTELLKLKLVGIDYAGNSLTNFIKKEKTEGSYMVLDIGSDTTMVSIVKDKVLKFNRNILSGTGFILDNIMNEYQVSQMEALKIISEKEILSTDENNYEYINNTFDQILYNVSRLMDYYTSRNQDKIENIYIIGGGSKIYNIDKYISNYFSINTQILNNFSSVIYKGNKSFSEAEMYFTNIIGTAFSKINLVPYNLTYKVDLNIKKRTFVLLLILVIVSFSGIFTFMQGQNLLLSKKKEELEANINKAKEVQEIRLKYDEINNRIKLRQQILEASKTKSEDFVAILEMMESKMPSDVFYLNMQDTGDSIEISCVARDKITVAKFIEALKSMDFLDVYVPSLTEISEEDENKAFISFSVSCKY